MNLNLSKTKISTRKAFGESLVKLGEEQDQLVVLDMEVGNSTYTNLFAKKFPDRFWQMFIAEQNAVSVALGMSTFGKIPFLATFAAFWTRAMDQIRMAQYSMPNIHLNLVGTHAGVSIGADGPSQMGLEDISMFRAILDSLVLYPSDAVATNKLVRLMFDRPGINYLRVTRADTPLIYDQNQEFVIGGSHTIFSSDQDQLTIVTAGITLFESIQAIQKLKEQEVAIRLIDLYSIKPLDRQTLVRAAGQTQKILVVEDHFLEGGIYGAVSQSLANLEENFVIESLSVQKTPRSGSPAELLQWEGIDSQRIAQKALEMIA